MKRFQKERERERVREDSIRWKYFHFAEASHTTLSFNPISIMILNEIPICTQLQDWPLKIKYVQLRDAGLYECVVSRVCQRQFTKEKQLNPCGCNNNWIFFLSSLAFSGDETPSNINFYSTQRCRWVLFYFKVCARLKENEQTLSRAAANGCQLFLQLSNWKNFAIFTEARAEISGPSEKYLKPGSVLRLTCRVVENIENPLYIFWYHNNRMINYDQHRGVNVSTEHGNASMHSLIDRATAHFSLSLFPFTDNRYSELQISQTTITHSGNYSCVTNNAVSSSTLVHIFNGESELLPLRRFASLAQILALWISMTSWEFLPLPHADDDW
jgi:hypothetical protein